ncbi:hypothetical protein JKF63_06067 [Porcisia hertigi]|uniref:Uncharacterized protein n=1 Tax=Porcisia hertigi TaxID=2761500 RepID=A0A836LEG8_9TRYP|nr:hypothetical protein JKF63_06067 [Porcisia hertigi]
MHASSNGSAARTMADLDEMEDKLRRLGLDVNHPTTAPSSCPSSAVHSGAEYISSIRAAKAEKQQARLDRLARLAAAAEKQGFTSPNTAAVALSAIDSGAETAREGHIAVVDKAVLASDVADAALRAGQRGKSDLEQQLRAERTLKAAADHQLTRTVDQNQLIDTFSSNMLPLASKVLAPESRERKRQEMTAWCGGVARGLAELAIEVSDNRHLPATGLGGRPVYRLHQDLSVTQWRQWVEKLVFSTSSSTDVAISPLSADDGAAGNDGDVADLLAPGNQDVQRQTSDAELWREAANCITSATEAEGKLAAGAQTEAVACVLAKLHAEVARQRKAAEEAVRLAADESSFPAPPAPEGEVDAPGVLRREELLPGWAQRMPPAACFVYGDDLSGARLLADTVDMCVQRKFQQQHSTLQLAHRRLVPPRQHLTTVGEVPEITPGALFPTAPTTTPQSDDLFSLFVVNEIGVESSDLALPEKSPVATYVTPRTLLANSLPGALSGDAKRGGSAGRQQRTQQHASSGGGNPVGGNGGSQGSAAAVSCSGSSGASSRSNQRPGALSPESRREYEQLIDAVVREVVRVHRHNLGVLAGDRMPSWASKSPGTATVGGLVETEADVSQTNPGASASVPLRTLFLVGFPDTASFAELLARRLRQATAAAESELMDVESRRRVAERQATVAAAAAVESSRQRSVLLSKGSKGSTAQPSRSKANRPAKAMAGAEELAVSAMMETLQATIALPPLVVLATFLVYDLPTRHRRLEAASLVADAAAPQRPGGEDGEDDLSTAGAVGGVVLRSMGPEFTHPVYNPSADDIQSCGLPSLPKDLAPTRSTNLRPGGASTAPFSPSLIPSPSPASALSFSTATAAAASLCVHTWNVERLRNELKHQHAQQKRQCKEWTAAVATGHGGDGEQPAGVLPSSVSSQRHSAKRRDKPMGNAVSNVAGVNLDTERASMSIASRVAETPSATAAKGPDEGGLPRALFFVRVQDVSDSTLQSAISDDPHLDHTRLGTAIWRAASTQPQVGDPQHGFAEARARTVDELMAQLRLLCRPGTGRVLTNESLVPRQLTEPLRLGDYRLSEATCALLKKTSKAFVGVLPAAPVPQSSERGGGFPREAAAAAAARDALTAEMEVWATVLQYSEQLYHLVAEEVFRDGVEHPELPADLPAPVAPSTTARFTRVDQSYAGAKEAIAAYTASAIAHLDDSLALLLRFSVDVCLTQLAASVRLFCHSIARHRGVEEGKLCSLLTSAAGSGDSDDDIGERFLRVAPRLSAEAARALVDSLRRPDGGETSVLLSANLAEVYWPQVTAAATEVAVQYFTSHSRENLASPASSSTTETPPGQLQGQLLVEGCEAVGESKSGVASDAAACKPEAQIMAEEHAPAVVQLLLEHAINAPAPLSRVGLLMQESHRMMWAVWDGAEAWVELLYREALAMHSAAPVSSPTPDRRPCSLDELADGPLAVLRIDVDDATSLRRPSLWQCSHLEMLLSAVRPATPNTMVSIDQFERGLLVHQLQRLWRFLPDASSELAAKANFLLTTHNADFHVPAPRVSRPATFASLTTGSLALPDSSLDAYLLTSCCPCRPPAEPPFPFLTVEDVKCLTAAAVAETATATPDAEPATMVDLELWLANLALQRCCFCDRCGASCDQPGRAEEQISQCTRACAAVPSSAAMRKTIATLPTSVLAQHTMLCATPMTFWPSLVSTPPPSPGEMPWEWMLAQWWWRAWCGEDASSKMEDVQRCYALWRILLGHVLPTPPPSSPECEVSTPSTMAPLLPSLLRLLIGIGRRAGSMEERVRRAFHCLAVLRRVRASDLEAHTGMARGDADADTVMFIEDDMVLTADECAALGRLLSPTARSVDNNAPATRTKTAETVEFVKGTHNFFTDVQLLLQVEGTEGVTLPLLFSSRWASLLMKEHF